MLKKFTVIVLTLMLIVGFNAWALTRGCFDCEWFNEEGHCVYGGEYSTGCRLLWRSGNRICFEVWEGTCAQIP
ncbi:hypothetical protein SCOR_31640 [Sulfidibacter corallicola]|uniref:Uncharacterized protein n=1 Tax=Sulfidibacter corallicola TaxID=2818388 RepID=A0A8A4TLY9_SULCO|nr:hypothetical protein [Sulfidibacter corallicola]QTD49898.1 hypothetical protein J3U87_30315 [Sulfidibacter corallicola]